MPTLLRRENELYRDQVVYMAGRAFANCTFDHCTIVVREATGVLENCTFSECLWHLDLFVTDRHQLAQLIDHLTPHMAQSLPRPEQAQTIATPRARRQSARPPGDKERAAGGTGTRGRPPSPLRTG